MKLNIFQSSMAIGISTLISYGFYHFNYSENNLLLALGSFIFIALTLILTIGVSFNLPRTGTMVRTVSGIFCAIAVLSNLVFTFLPFSIPVYIVLNGLLLLVFLSVAFAINQQRQ